jgi:hypothetical protein
MFLNYKYSVIHFYDVPLCLALEAIFRNCNVAIYLAWAKSSSMFTLKIMPRGII